MTNAERILRTKPSTVYRRNKQIYRGYFEKELRKSQCKGKQNLNVQLVQIFSWNYNFHKQHKQPSFQKNGTTCLATRVGKSDYLYECRLCKKNFWEE